MLSIADLWKPGPRVQSGGCWTPSCLVEAPGAEVLSTSEAVALSCQSERKSLQKLNMQRAVPGGSICVQRWCDQHACSCQQADRTSNVSGQCTHSVKLLLALWEGNLSCSLPKCTHFRLWDGNPGKDLLTYQWQAFTMAIADKTSQNMNYAFFALFQLHFQNYI